MQECRIKSHENLNVKQMTKKNNKISIHADLIFQIKNIVTQHMMVNKNFQFHNENGSATMLCLWDKCDRDSRLPYIPNKSHICTSRTSCEYNHRFSVK